MPARASAAAPLFAALGDPVRLGIVVRLCREGPLPTITLTEGTGVTRQAVTKHLRLLEDVGLVESARAGRDRSWQVDTRRIEDLRATLARISAQWDARIARLKAFVEE